MMNRKQQVKKIINKWQEKLELSDWNLGIDLVEFKRKDYKQSGDIKVNIKNKQATIYLSINPFKEDELVIVHELVHQIFWEYDVFSEKLIPRDKKNLYFEKLEKTVTKVTETLLIK